MPSLIKPADWNPEGIALLEPAALRVARSRRNILVVAGPGAGKTELLAQRASFLLKTGTCCFPKRILAISFKRDAARNLKERVQLRCGLELGRRFDSYTFDAFAKSLMDRFRNALPTQLKPSGDYEINFDIEKRFSDWLENVGTNNRGLTLAQIKSIRPADLYENAFLGASLSSRPMEPETTNEVAADAVWNELLKVSNPSQLNFQMIGRLAELILHQNPKLLAALRSTYAFLFLDEFQDTTNIQFALTVAAFSGSKTVVTAVGDDKQRIMVWAGALETVFEDFENEFDAERETLLLNHRSAPELVRIQNHFVQILDAQAPAPEAAKPDLEGECRILVFPNHIRESQGIADLVAIWISEDGLDPRGICILTRNRPEQYTTFIIEALHSRGVKARVETEIQDLLTEPVVTLILSLLKVALTNRAKDAWLAGVAIYLEVNGIDSKSLTVRRVENELTSFLKKLGPVVETMSADEGSVRAVVNRLLAFVGETKLRQCYPQYRQGTWFEETIANCVNHLVRLRGLEDDWVDALDHLSGKDCVPIMTIHKSKGLEYHSVLFVGLEDSALWKFEEAPEEEKRAFFVAFSRAISRVVFTFCEIRERGKGPQPQRRAKIGMFYEVLKSAGVEEESIELKDKE